MAEITTFKAGTHDWLEHYMRGQERQRIRPNAYVIRGDAGVLYVRFFSTDVMVVSPEDIIKLDNGGWDGQRTKSLMNELLPDGLKVYQYHGAWYVRATNGIFRYRNGMFVDAKDSTVLGEPELEQEDPR